MSKVNLFSTNSGLATLNADVIKIMTLLDQCFSIWAKDFQSEFMIFPSLIKVSDLVELDYFHKFPHLGVLTASIKPNYLEKKEYINSQIKQEVSNHLLSSSSYALPSAPCYNIFLHLKNTVQDVPNSFTTVAKCFRQEKYYEELARLLGFTVREFVYIGTDHEIASYISECKSKILNFSSSLGLSVEVKTADDPFYDSKSHRAKVQKLFKIKEEILYDGKLALSSLNFHLNFFGKRCNIRLSSDEFIFSGCVGMGLERWVYALLDRYDNNVELICNVLENYKTL